MYLHDGAVEGGDPEGCCTYDRGDESVTRTCPLSLQLSLRTEGNILLPWSRKNELNDLLAAS